MHEEDPENTEGEREFKSITGQRLLVGIDKINKGVYFNIPWQKAGGMTLSPEVTEKLVLELAGLIKTLRQNG
jgi:hypothetical protein